MKAEHLECCKSVTNQGDQKKIFQLQGTQALAFLYGEDPFKLFS